MRLLAAGTTGAVIGYSLPMLVLFVSVWLLVLFGMNPSADSLKAWIMFLSGGSVAIVAAVVGGSVGVAVEIIRRRVQRRARA